MNIGNIDTNKSEVEFFLQSIENTINNIENSDPYYRQQKDYDNYIKLNSLHKLKFFIETNRELLEILYLEKRKRNFEIDIVHLPELKLTAPTYIFLPVALILFKSIVLETKFIKMPN